MKKKLGLNKDNLQSTVLLWREELCMLLAIVYVYIFIYRKDKYKTEFIFVRDMCTLPLLPRPYTVYLDIGITEQYYC